MPPSRRTAVSRPAPSHSKTVSAPSVPSSTQARTTAAPPPPPAYNNAHPQHHSTPASAPHPMAPPPAMAPPAAPPAQAPGGGGGFLSGIMGGVVQGMALGTGSAIAHHAVDSIMGPRKVEHVHNNAPAPEAPAAPAAPAGSTPMQCANEYSTFQECVKNAGGDISACQFYMDMLSKCQKQFPSA